MDVFRNKTARVVQIFLVLSVGFILFAVISSIVRGNEYSKIVCGMSKMEVVKIAGMPDWEYDESTWGYGREMYGQGKYPTPIHRNYYSLVIKFDNQYKVCLIKRHIDITQLNK